MVGNCVGDYPRLYRALQRKLRFPNSVRPGAELDAERQIGCREAELYFKGGNQSLPDSA